MTLPKLFGTPLSHFTRKIRIVLAELGRVPTLVHGDDTVIESDHIARYLVGRYDRDDRLTAPEVA